MKKGKRVLTLLLALIMVLTCLAPVQTVSVSAKTKGLNKTKATLYQKETVKLSVSGAGSVKWTSGNKKIATVSSKGVVTAKKAGKVKITAKTGGKSYTCIITVKKKPAVTRAEWISALMKKAGISEADITTYHFSDTKKLSSGKLIETAYSMGILPGNGKKFYPNRPATREFMAVTAVRALGFEADSSETPDCRDADKLSYAAEDQVALNQGFLSLKKNKFCPSKAITKAEKKKALKAVEKILKAEQVDAAHTDSVEYQDGVVESALAGETDYTVTAQGDELIVSVTADEATEALKEGDVVVLPAKTGTNEQTAVKVSSVTKNSDGTLTITGETPEISDVYSTISVQEETYVDMSGFVPNEEMEVSASTTSLKGASATGELTVGSSTTITLDETKLGSVGTFTGKITLSAPKLTVILDADFSTTGADIHQATVTLSQDVTASVELKGSGSGSYCLGHVTQSLNYGLFVDVVCYLNVSADGKGTVGYTLSNSAGMSYINGDLRLTADSTGSWDGMNAQVNAEALAEPQVNLRLFGIWTSKSKLVGAINILGVQADVGPKLKATLTTHETAPNICANVGLYAYLSVGLNTDSGFGKLLKEMTDGKLALEKVILDNNDANPLRATWHYEDGARTDGDVCTWEETEAEPIEMIKLTQGEEKSVQLDDTEAEETIVYDVTSEIVEKASEEDEEEGDGKVNFWHDVLTLKINGKVVFEGESSAEWFGFENESEDIEAYEIACKEEHYSAQIGISDIDVSDGAKDIFIWAASWRRSGGQYIYRLQYKNGEIIQKENVQESLTGIDLPNGMYNYLDNNIGNHRGFLWNQEVYHVETIYKNGKWTIKNDSIESVDAFTTTGDGTADWSVEIWGYCIFQARMTLKLSDGKLTLASKKPSGNILGTGSGGAVTKKFTAYTTAGGSKKAFTVKKYSTIKFISYKCVGKKIYIKIKKSGKTGWVSVDTLSDCLLNEYC